MSTVVISTQDVQADVYGAHGEKGVIGGWYGGPLNGSEPRPASRTYWIHNNTSTSLDYDVSLLCLNTRLVKGGKVKKPRDR